MTKFVILTVIMTLNIEKNCSK